MTRQHPSSSAMPDTQIGDAEDLLFPGWSPASVRPTVWTTRRTVARSPCALDLRVIAGVKRMRRGASCNVRVERTGPILADHQAPAPLGCRLGGRSMTAGPWRTRRRADAPGPAGGIAARSSTSPTQRGLLVRLMGGMAIRAHAPDWPARTRRVEVDLDFATRGKDRGAFYELLAAEGYTADKRHNALFGGKQAYFVDVPRSRPVDVLVDSLEMCHRFEFGDRLAHVEPDPAAGRAPPVEAPGRQDQPQGRARCARPARRAPARPDDGAPDSRHGLGVDQRAADPVVHLERLGLVADRDRQPRHARPVPRRRADARTTSTSTTGGTILFDPGGQIAALRAAIDDAPKSTRWKLRARRSASARPGTRIPRRWGTTDADLLRHGHPRLRGLLAQVPERRQVPQGGRPDHGRRHDRQGDGPDRRRTARTGSSSSRASATS